MNRAIVILLVSFVLICLLKAIMAHAEAPKYFPLGSTWIFRADPQGYLVAKVNSVYYGRVALGTYFQYGVSYLVPDEIFQDGFSGASSKSGLSPKAGG